MQKGSLICFVGVDGSGKTTQSKMLVDWFASQGIKSMYIWSRGEVLPVRRVVLLLGRKALGTSEREIANDKRAYREYQSKKSRLMRNPLVRMIWSTLARFEHIAQINRDVRTNVREGYIVVCDRYLWDSTVDLAILNNKKPEWILNRMNRLAWRLIPKPTMTFFIDIPPEEALKRKDDIPSLEYVKRRVDLYRYLSKSQPMITINGVDNPECIRTRVIDLVKDHIELR